MKGLWGVLLFSFLCFFSFLFRKVSPMGVSIGLIVFSILVGAFIYKFYLSIFPCGGLLISFSSGMMIIFCYCSFMVDFDSKNTPSYSALLLFCSSALLLFWESSIFPLSYGLSSSLFLSGSFVVFAMCVVLITMFSVNLSMFSPSKSFFNSY